MLGSVAFRMETGCIDKFRQEAKLMVSWAVVLLTILNIGIELAL
jgi:hypothetical protein